MKNKNIDFEAKRILGIIGVGPRGLYALENLISKLIEIQASSQIQILLFEETGNYGNGSVYNTNQVNTNWINISERSLELETRSEKAFDEIIIPAFPSYHQWINKKFTIHSKTERDNYPPRAKIGAYLKQRFESIVNPLLLADRVILFNESVKEVNLMDNGKINLETNLNTHKNLDEILLTIGHQPTKLSEQLLAWESYAESHKNVKLFIEPYPIQDLLRPQALITNSSIGVRGFGLAMIDVVRGIASNYGTFKIVDKITMASEYTTTDNNTIKFVPFSLDGLPPAPKPLNAQIDEAYKPTTDQISNFERKIGNPSRQKEAKNDDLLIDAIAPIIARIYLNLPQTHSQNDLSILEIEQIAKHWLKTDTYEHTTITPRKQSAKKIMKAFVDMATGISDVSLDYCIGQIWRHCQPSIYEQLSYNKCNKEVFAEIINLDERMKRYAYGPPVESIQQMLALESANVMTFDFVNNPEIELTKKGWNLKLKGKAHTVEIMINSVLDAPQIKSVSSTIVKQLLLNDLIKPVHDDFGILTDNNGYIIPDKSIKIRPIALLGRLAKGTIIGVDAILECFGNRPKNWSDEAAKRHADWLNNNTPQLK